MVLSRYLRTHIMGDPLQGIFGFKGDPLVDMNNPALMGVFMSNCYTLTTPWRWKLNGREDLGVQLDCLRAQLIKQQNVAIDYSAYPAIAIHRVRANDYAEHFRIINNIMGRHPNVLLIHPVSTSTKPRVDIVQQFNNRVYMLESLDDKDFYSLAKRFDALTPDNVLPEIYAICEELFGKTRTQEWLTNEKVKARHGDNKALSLKLKEIMDFTTANLSYGNIASILDFFRIELRFPVSRVDLFNSLRTSLNDAHQSNSSVYEGMCNARNRLRRHGRKIHGHCIGTTLLTKGLECDCVVLLGIDQFNRYKDLYVALTRGSKEIMAIKYVS